MKRSPLAVAAAVIALGMTVSLAACEGQIPTVSAPTESASANPDLTEDQEQEMREALSPRDVENEETGLSDEEEVIVIENQPCKLSFKKLTAASQTETAAAVSQVIKLFLAPEINVKAGSKLVVTQNGVTGKYSASGIPAVYSTHQEIVLELWEGWA